MIFTVGALRILLIYTTHIHRVHGFPIDSVTRNISLTRESAQLTVQYAKWSLSWDGTSLPLNPTTDPRVVLRVDGSGQAVQVRVEASRLPQATSGEQARPLCLDEYLTIWDGQYREKLTGKLCEQQPVDILSYTDYVLIQIQLYYVTATLDDTVTLKLSRVECGQTALRCPSDPSKCAILEAICDGKKDCPQGEDEICTTDCGKPKIPPDAVGTNLRIIGGVEASVDSWPWQVLIESTCGSAGGTVIGPRWILTQGDVVVKGEKTVPENVITVSFLPQTCDGRDTPQHLQVGVEKVFAHPLYRKKPGWKYDTALLLLKKDTVLTMEGVKAICLPRPNMGPLGGEVCYTAGCGIQNVTDEERDDPVMSLLSFGKLKQVSAPILPATECVLQGHQPDVQCVLAGGKQGICGADWGGSLVCKKSSKALGEQWHQFAVTPFHSAAHEACERSTTAFIKVKHSMPFIVQTLHSQKFVGWFTNRTVPAPVRPIIREWEDDVKIPQTDERSGNSDGSGSLRSGETSGADSSRKVSLRFIQCRYYSDVTWKAIAGLVCLFALLYDAHPHPMQ